jgi:outer membrane protein
MILNRLIIGLSALLLSSVAVSALTLEDALRHAYQNNPDLNQQRAALRVTDESVPTALSGYRPSLSASASAGVNRSDIITYSGATSVSKQAPRTAGVTLSQPLFDGMRTYNNVNAAEQSVLLGREDLKNKEQTVFLAVITAYMNVIRDNATVDLRLRAVGVAERDLTMINERFRLGDASRTDVGLVEAQRGLSKLALATSKTNLAISKSQFLQHVGLAPNNLKSPAMMRQLPKSQDAARQIAVSTNPVVKAAQYGADAAKYQVYVAESALYPQLSVDGSYNRGIEVSSGVANSASSSLTARLVIPIFANGGRDSSTIRAAKETQGQRQIQIDTAREIVKQALGQSWGVYEVAALAIAASNEEIKGREAVVRGFREEYKVGQRILQNVLVEEVNLNNARVSAVFWQRERIVAQYSILAAMGQLNAQSLKLKTDNYNPNGHYDNVRDAWLGTRTPDGR